MVVGSIQELRAIFGRRSVGKQLHCHFIPGVGRCYDITLIQAVFTVSKLSNPCLHHGFYLLALLRSNSNSQQWATKNHFGLNQLRTIMVRYMYQSQSLLLILFFLFPFSSVLHAVEKPIEQYSSHAISLYKSVKDVLDELKSNGVLLEQVDFLRDDETINIIINSLDGWTVLTQRYVTIYDKAKGEESELDAIFCKAAAYAREKGDDEIAKAFSTLLSGEMVAKNTPGWLNALEVTTVYAPGCMVVLIVVMTLISRQADVTSGLDNEIAKEMFDKYGHTGLDWIRQLDAEIARVSMQRDQLNASAEQPRESLHTQERTILRNLHLMQTTKNKIDKNLQNYIKNLEQLLEQFNA